MKHDIPERYTLAFRLYPYAKSPDQAATTSVRHKAVVVGGGPIGLATALDLGSGLIDHIQKMTIAAITMADMKAWAQRS